jgi:hypothetical protein
MGLGYGIWLVILGVLGAANLIIARKPDAKEVIAKLAPYQGWIGAISVFGGIWMIFGGLGALGAKAIWGITYLAEGGVQIALGLLLGVGILKTFVKNAEAGAKMDQMIAKLSPYQGTLGLVAIGLGVWGVIVQFL